MKQRRALAKAADTPADALRALADDPDDAVRAAVAAHRNTPVETVERLVYDPVGLVRAKARGNRGLCRADRARLGQISDVESLRVCLAQRVAAQAPWVAAFRLHLAACGPEGATLPPSLRRRLDEALCDGPSPEAWRALCDALEGPRWTDDLLAAAVAVLAPRLAAWPDALRVTDPRWMQRLDKGVDDPRLGLARTGLAAGPKWSERFVLHLAACPWTAAWTSLALRDIHLGPEGASVLFASPWLGPLRALDLRGAALGDAGVRSLVACPALSTVSELGLGWCGLGTEGFQALGDAPFAATLLRLDLAANGGVWRPSDAPAAHTATWARFARLASLRLTYNHLGDEGLAAFLSSPCAATLRDLDLQANALTDAACRTIASSSHLAGLERLVLVANLLSAEGLRALAASPHLGALRVLDVSCSFAKAEAGAVEAALAPMVARGCAVTADALAF